MKYRIHTWHSMRADLPPGYGIQVQRAPKQRYKNAAATIRGIHRALIYQSPELAERAVAAMREGRTSRLHIGLTPLKN